MSVSREYTIWCDTPDCPSWLQVCAATVEAARKQWRKEGWSLGEHLLARPAAGPRRRQEQLVGLERPHQCPRCLAGENAGTQEPMKITIENTSKIVTLDGVQVRVWEGTTEKGVRVQAFVARVAAFAGDDVSEFERDLEETRAPSADVASLPPNLRS